MTFRMYVDEVGNSGLNTSSDSRHRYLSLTGVVFDLDHVAEVVSPRLEDLKWRHFRSHPDEPLVLHRKELVNKRPPFDRLRDAEAEAHFNQDLLGLLRDSEYIVITVAIDKWEHHTRYSVWHYDPYHYCLMALVERYAVWLEEQNQSGDVLAEGRGGNEDMRLKQSYETLWQRGTEYISAHRLQAALTSRQLKVKRKDNNIAGLQIADLVAHPSQRAMVIEREQLPPKPDFGAQIETILCLDKYRRSTQGQIAGWGKKWLP